MPSSSLSLLYVRVGVVGRIVCLEMKKRGERDRERGEERVRERERGEIEKGRKRGRDREIRRDG